MDASLFLGSQSCIWDLLHLLWKSYRPRLPDLQNKSWSDASLRIVLRRATLRRSFVCKWFRVRGNRTYQIEEISSNIYQLNAEDIGCMIKVEATTINAEEGEGQAFG